MKKVFAKVQKAYIDRMATGEDGLFYSDMGGKTLLSDGRVVYYIDQKDFYLNKNVLSHKVLDKNFSENSLEARTDYVFAKQAEVTKKDGKRTFCKLESEDGKARAYLNESFVKSFGSGRKFKIPKDYDCKVPVLVYNGDNLVGLICQVHVEKENWW